MIHIQDSPRIQMEMLITAAHTNNEFQSVISSLCIKFRTYTRWYCAEGGPITKLLGNTLTFGAGTAGTDITINI